METTAERGKRVRQRLLATAAELIAERGWAAVSTRMIADRAGVAGGVVHYHFASVQALLREAAMSVISGMIDQMVPMLTGAGPVRAPAAASAVGMRAKAGTATEAPAGANPTETPAESGTATGSPTGANPAGAAAGAGSADEVLAMMFGFLDEYDGRDPTSLLFTETYLAATRDETLRRELGAEVDRFRAVLADRLAAAGVASPRATAALLAAAVDGVILHRALLPGLAAADLLPVLRRLITAKEES